MRKIISLFARNYEGDRLVRNEVVLGAQWVLAGEGIATRKWDGTCCMVRAGQLFRRFDAKAGKTPPVGFEPAQDADEITGHWPGWMPIGEDAQDRWHQEAFQAAGLLADGTYELCGPKIQKNPEHYSTHVLLLHGSEILNDCPRTFDDLRLYLSERDIEGIVWHHADGRMVKIKKKDFGFRR